MLFKYTTIAALSLALLGTPLQNAEAQSARGGANFEQKFKFFKVRGKTNQQIFRDFQKKSPIKGVGKHQATLGVASIKITPQVKFAERKGRCKVLKSKVEVDVVIHLPRWANYRSANKFAKKSWDTLFADIKRHELVHAKIAKDYGNRIKAKIDSLGSRSSCKSLDRLITRRSNSLLKKHDRAQRKFDRDEQKRLLRGKRRAFKV